MGAEVPRWLSRAAAVGWRLLVVGAAVYYGGLTISALRIVIVPLLLGLFVTALLRPVTRLGERVMPASLAALLSVALATAALAATLTILGFGIAGQLQEVGDAVTRGWQQLVRFAASSPIAGWADWGGLDSSLTDALQSRAGGLASKMAAGAESLVTFVTQLLLTIVFAFFFVRDGRSMFDYLVKRLKSVSRTKARRAGARAWDTLGRYLRGLALIASCNSLLKGLALLIIGVPLVLPIMLLTFIGSFIPFAGPLIAGTVAGLVALANGSWVDGALVVGAALCIQGIEGNVLQPYVLGRTMRLHPVVILAGVSAGTILAGLAGAFLAVPVLAVLVTVTSELNDGHDAEADRSEAEDYSPSSGSPAPASGPSAEPSAEDASSAVRTSGSSPSV